SALEPVVDALVRARRWDDAVEIVDEIAMTYRQAGSWVSTWNGDPLLANSRSDHRALCAIAIGLAESGDLEQGLAAAHWIDDTVAHAANGIARTACRGHGGHANSRRRPNLGQRRQCLHVVGWSSSRLGA